MKMELVRFCYGTDATLGYLQAGSLTLATIERPWIPDKTYGSAPSVSCVPDGEYRVVPHNSSRFPDTFALVNEGLQVARYKRPRNRYGILIHVGNRASDVEGCIAVGLTHRILEDEPWVLNSADAMSDLRDALAGGEHTLVIRRTEGAPYERTS